MLTKNVGASKEGYILVIAMIECFPVETLS